MPRYAFEDFSVGQVLDLGFVTADKDEMIAFARRFDPQPFHLSEENAKATFPGRLVAPGWYSCSLMTKLLAERYLVQSTLCGGAGMQELRWHKPVLPGDRLHVQVCIVSQREARSKPGFGLIDIEAKLVNQHDDIVLSNITTIMMALRGVSIKPNHYERPLKRVCAPAQTEIQSFSFIEDVAIGEKYVLGTHTFTPEDIRSFAQIYDPQPFHLDAEAAERSYLGGLCASGIQTAAQWTTFSALYNAQTIELARKEKKIPPCFGVSPGFKELRWFMPVFAGDEITYRSEVVGKHGVPSLHGWGLLMLKASGENQYGQKVLEYRPSVLLKSCAT